MLFLRSFHTQVHLMCERPSGANVTEQFFIELQYFLDMYNLKLFCIVFVLLYLFYMFEINVFFNVCFFQRMFVSAFYLKTWLVHFMFSNAKTI